MIQLCRTNYNPTVQKIIRSRPLHEENYTCKTLIGALTTMSFPLTAYMLPLTTSSPLPPQHFLYMKLQSLIYFLFFLLIRIYFNKIYFQNLIICIPQKYYVIRTWKQPTFEVERYTITAKYTLILKRGASPTIQFRSSGGEGSFDRIRPRARNLQ